MITEREFKKIFRTITDNEPVKLSICDCYFHFCFTDIRFGYLNEGEKKQIYQELREKYSSKDDKLNAKLVASLCSDYRHSLARTLCVKFEKTCPGTDFFVYDQEDRSILGLYHDGSYEHNNGEEIKNEATGQDMTDFIVDFFENHIDRDGVTLE